MDIYLTLIVYIQNNMYLYKTPGYGNKNNDTYF